MKDIVVVYPVKETAVAIANLVEKAVFMYLTFVLWVHLLLKLHIKNGAALLFAHS